MAEPSTEKPDSERDPEQLRARIRELEAEVERLGRVEAELLQERDRAQRYVDIASVMIVILDRSGCIRLVNRMACEVLEDDEAGLLGEDWFATFVPDGVRDEVRQTFDRLMEGAVDSDREYSNAVVTRSGAQRIVNWRNTVLIDEEGDAVGTLSSGMDITERLRSEQELAESRHRYQTLFHLASIGIGILRPDGKVLESNRYLKDLLGFAPWEMQGLNLLAFVAERERRQELAAALHERGRLRGREVLLRRDDGTPIQVVMDLDPVRLGEGDSRLITVRDVTARKRAELELRRSRTRYQALFDLAPVGIGILSARGYVLEANQVLAGLVGWESTELIGRRVEMHVVASAEFDRLRSILRRQGRVRGYELRLGHRRGQREIPVRVDVDGVLLDGKDVYLATVQDLSGQRRVEEALVESKRTLTTLMSNLPGMVYRCRNERRWTMEFVSEGCLALTGYSRHDLEDNRTVAYGDLIVPEDRDPVWNQVQEAIAEQRPFRLDYRIRTADGDVHHVWENGRAVFDEAGEVEALEGFITDVSEQRRVEEHLRFTQFAVDHASDFIFWMDPEGRITYLNEAACEALGYRAEEVVGQGVVLLDPSFTAEGWARARRRLDEHRTLTFETEQRTRAGESVPVEVTLNHLSFLGQEYYCAIARDTRERRQAEADRERMQAQLLRAQRMEAMGNLAGGVAHDFNNLLTAIQGYTDLALRRREDPRAVARNLEMISTAAVRSGKLTRQLLLFSRRQPMKRTPLDLNQAVDSLLALLQRVIGENIRVERELAPDLGLVSGDESGVEQVLMNLALNARDAMPEGGELFIRTRNVQVSAEDCEPGSDSRPGRFVCLEVEDTGSGMGPETLQHLFEPFYTTKEEGTGLGLSVVYGIVKRHQGWIDVEAEPEQGAVFRVFFPVAEGYRRRRKRSSGAEADWRASGERILLVEDDPEVREFTGAALRELGCEVVAVEDAEAALEHVAAASTPFRALFSDVVLPGMSGLELANRLVAGNPRLEVVLSSGYTDNRVGWESIQGRGYHFLHKPYRYRNLTETLRALFTGAEGSC